MGGFAELLKLVQELAEEVEALTIIVSTNANWHASRAGRDLGQIQAIRERLGSLARTEEVAKRDFRPYADEPM